VHPPDVGAQQEKTSLSGVIELPIRFDERSDYTNYLLEKYK